MKPLSTFNFIKGSLGKILPLAITVCLSVGLMYFFILIMNQLTDNNEVFDVIPLSNMSVIEGNNVVLSEDEKAADIQKLTDNKDIKAWYFTTPWIIEYQTISKSHSILMLLLQEQNIPFVMKWQKLELIEGVLPKNKMEIVLHKKLTDKYNLKLGATIKAHTQGWHIGEDMKIVGIIDGPAIMNFAAEDEEKLMKQDFSVITLADDAHLSGMNQFLEEQYGSKYDLMTLERGYEELNNTKRSIKLVLIFIGIIILITLSVLLGNICMIQYAQRKNEFELLHAIGYTKKYITYKVFQEIGSSNLLGYFWGIIFGIMIGWLVNVSVFQDSSAMPLIQINSMLILLFIPLIVTLSGMLAPLKMLNLRDMM